MDVTLVSVGGWSLYRHITNSAILSLHDHIKRPYYQNSAGGKS